MNIQNFGEVFFKKIIILLIKINKKILAVNKGMLNNLMIEHMNEKKQFF